VPPRWTRCAAVIVERWLAAPHEATHVE